MFLASVVCCHVQVSARGLSLVQRSLTKWDVSECDRDASIIRPCPKKGFWATRKEIKLLPHLIKLIVTILGAVAPNKKQQTTTIFYGVELH